MSHHRGVSLRVRAGLAAGALGLAVSAITAQEIPAGLVRYTEAREHAVRRSVELTGTVESRTASLVASEVEGLVVEVPVREGDRVRREQPLAKLRTTSLELTLRAARAQLKEATSRLKLAERNLERARDLYGSQALSQQQLDDSLSELDAWQGRADQLTARIAQIEFDLERCTIRAPYTGVVVAKRTEVGEWVELGGPVVEILSLEELEVRVEVPERYFRALEPGSGAAVAFEALPGMSVSGRVSSIIPRADPQARTFPVKVRIPNAEGRVGVGMLAQVSLPAGESYHATVVPKDAVITQGQEQFVYLIDGNNTVSRVAVETVAGVGAWVAVNGSVRAGQRVVTRGNERLQPGQPVRGEPLEYALP